MQKLLQKTPQKTKTITDFSRILKGLYTMTKCDLSVECKGASAYRRQYNMPHQHNEEKRTYIIILLDAERAFEKKFNTFL